jgi:apolipoprotein D and lipocalin family protein
MSRTRMRSKTLAMLIAICAFAGCAGGGSDAPLESVPHLDLNRYLGEWHEMARYPNRFERDCDHDITASYSIQSDGRIRVVNSCITLDGKTKRSTGSAKVVDNISNAKLHVTFFWPFYGSYWVIGLDPDYKWAVVGEPSRKYLWILSRSTVIDDSTYARIILLVKDNGYDPGKLMRSDVHPNSRRLPSVAN